MQRTLWMHQTSLWASWHIHGPLHGGWFGSLKCLQRILPNHWRVGELFDEAIVFSPVGMESWLGRIAWTTLPPSPLTWMWIVVLFLLAVIDIKNTIIDSHHFAFVLIWFLLCFPHFPRSQLQGLLERTHECTRIRGAGLLSLVLGVHPLIPRWQWGNEVMATFDDGCNGDLMEWY